MAGETSLLDWILSLLRDPDARTSFQADPSGYAARHGFEGLSAADVHDALYLIADNGSASYDYQFGRWSEAHYPAPGDYQENQPAAEYLNHYITQDYPAANEPWPGSASDQGGTPDDARYGEGAVHDPHEHWDRAGAAWAAPHGDPSTAFGSGDTSARHAPADPDSEHSSGHADDVSDEFNRIPGYAEHGQHAEQPDDSHTGYPGDDPAAGHTTFPGADTDGSYTDAHHG